MPILQDTRRQQDRLTNIQWKKKQTEEKAKVIAAVWGTDFMEFHAALKIQHQDDLKTWMNRRTDALQNGCFRKMDDHLVHHSPKMDVLPKTFLQIILAAKQLVRHSSTSPKQQRRSLPSLLCKYFFYGGGEYSGRTGRRENCGKPRSLLLWLEEKVMEKENVF